MVITVVFNPSPYESLGIPIVEIGSPIWASGTGAEPVPIVSSVTTELPLSIIFMTVSKLPDISSKIDELIDVDTEAVTCNISDTFNGDVTLQSKLPVFSAIAANIESFPNLIISSTIPNEPLMCIDSKSVPLIDDVI